MKKIATNVLFLAMLVGCGTKNPDFIGTLPFKVISPYGAPTVALYKIINNSNLEINTTPANIRASFATKDKDVIIFDTLNALSMIKAEGHPFKLAQVITNGNYYIVGINKSATSEMTSSDYIVNFGANLTPDNVYTYLYPHLVDNTYYVDGVQQAAATVCSGKHNSHDVDYVFMAQPSLFEMMNNHECNTYGKLTIVKNIQLEWKNKTGLEGIPQAGIFIRNLFYEKQKDDFKAFIKIVDDTIDEVNNDPSHVRNQFTAFGTKEEQKNAFSVSADFFEEYGGSLGLTKGGVDINAFLTIFGKPLIDENLLLDIYK